MNRKQAEVSLGGDSGIAIYEARVREVVLARIARGKVQVMASVERGPGSVEVRIDRERAAAFAKQARALAKDLGLRDDVTLDAVLAAPGVLQTAGSQSGDLWPLILKALITAMEGLESMRAREGAALKKSLERGAARIAAAAKRVLALAPGVPRRQRESLSRRLAAAGVPVDLSDARLVTEIALFAERCDITEELTRIASHVAQFREALESRVPAGRTLEFIVQELGREWNTTGAKAGDASISRLVVEAKAELDRVREQIANIE